MSGTYKEFSGLNLPVAEREVLARWQQENTFEQSVTLRQGAAPFVFYEGPPSANGMPGIHHVISRTLKDLVCRYKTMRGYQVKRKGGWDTHGLPVELGVEKELGIRKEDIGVKISIAEYNQKCREVVLRYKKEWDDLTRKMGYWVDLNDPYITFTNEYIESLWWLLKKMYDRGLLYLSVSIQPYSPAAGTGLSSHELNQPGTYKDVKDTSATVMFSTLQDDHSKWLHDAVHGAEVFLMAWTTTPWTLPSNLGLAVGAHIEYVLVNTINPYTHLPVSVVLAKDLLGKYLRPEGAVAVGAVLEAPADAKAPMPWYIVQSCTGSQLEGIRYEQLLPFEANSLQEVKAITPDADPWRVMVGDFVTTEDGTGIVHIAPAFGADDYKVGKKYNIGILTMVDRQGKFVEGLGEFSSRYVKNYKDDPDYVDVNVDICVKLKKENRAFKVEKYEHNYPHCWRTDKPILYYPLEAWFVRTTALKDRMVERNAAIRWKPASTGTGRFGNWLENMVDWNLSRSRYWGTPLPIWRNEEGTEEKCIGSIAELQAALHPESPVKNITDLHKPQVDEVWLQDSRGGIMKRVPDLIDVWFDSGAMPYAQWHFPFENKEIFAANYPADFIAEGVDQTRGWFYTLHAIGSLLQEDIEAELKAAGLSAEKVDGRAYKTVVSNGLVLDKFGNKMSKRLGNVVDPFKTIESYGADATRWYLMTNASPWENLKFDVKGIEEVQRKFFGTLYNTYQFFALYANIDGFSFSEAYIPLAQRPEIDRWIISSLHTLVQKATAAMDDYEPTQAGRLMEDFLDTQLSNWYVRLCRRRFWKNEMGSDKLAAYQTLYECLETLTLLMAPISPFFSDELFLRLNQATGRHAAASVHHVLYPTAHADAIDTALEQRMALAQQVCSLVLSIRKKENIKVRQPLQKVLIPVLNPAMKAQLERVEDLIKAEVNVKEIDYLTETEGFIRKKVKPNYARLGKKLGPLMKAVSAALATFTDRQIAALEGEGTCTITVQDQTIALLLEEVEIVAEDVPGWSVASAGSVTVALDISLTEALRQEGNAREFVNRLQNIRKDSGLQVTDRIQVVYHANDVIKTSLDIFKTYICAEILADTLEWVPELNGALAIEVNEAEIKVQVNKKEE